MSGGSYDYLYSKVEEMANNLRDTSTDARRASFQGLLLLVAQAMHDIEWVDSCDYGDGEDHQSIDAVFAFLGSPPDTITKAHAFDQLKKQLKQFLA